MGKMTHEEKLKMLKTDSVTRLALENLTGKFGDNIPDDLLDLLVDIQKFSSVPPRQVLNWVFNLLNATESVCSGKAHNADYSMFWIGLFGVIEELPECYESQVKDLETILKEGHPNTNAFLDSLKALLAESHTITAIYTEDELTVIDVERQSKSHIFQKGLRFSGRLREDGNYSVRRTYKNQDKLEINAAFEREFRKYGMDENKMAQAYAGKVRLQLLQLYLLVQKHLPLAES